MSSNNCLNELNTQTYEAVSKNDVNLLKNIMLSTNFPSIAQKEKEAEVFKTVRISFTHGNAKKLIEYLIFDYEISEEYNNTYQTKNSNIEHMFSLRKLNKKFN